MNTLEGVRILRKRGLDGVHHVVSKKYLQDYLNAYAFGWNPRDSDHPRFFEMLEQIPVAPKEDE